MKAEMVGAIAICVLVLAQVIHLAVSVVNMVKQWRMHHANKRFISEHHRERCDRCGRGVWDRRICSGERRDDINLDSGGESSDSRVIPYPKLQDEQRPPRNGKRRT